MVRAAAGGCGWVGDDEQLVGRAKHLQVQGFSMFRSQGFRGIRTSGFLGFRISRFRVQGFQVLGAHDSCNKFHV